MSEHSAEIDVPGHALCSTYDDDLWIGFCCQCGWSEANGCTREQHAQHVATTVTPPAEKDANVALSVWSNTCNAYCPEEGRTHAPECLLAAGLYESLRRVTPPGQPASPEAAR